MTMDHLFDQTYQFQEVDQDTLPKPESCVRCLGTGWLERRYSSRSFPGYVKCSCALAREADDVRTRLMANSGVELMEDKSFDSLELTGHPTPKSIDAAFGHAVNFAEGRVERPWLLLYGAWGVGKTHLAIAIVQHWIRNQGRSAVFGVVPDLIDRLRAGYRDGTYDTMITELKTVDLLALDDFGIGKSNAESNEYRLIFQVLNNRSMQRRPTVITTNLNPDQVEPRMRSRLMDKSLCLRVEIVSRDSRVY